MKIGVGENGENRILAARNEKAATAPAISDGIRRISKRGIRRSGIGIFGWRERTVSSFGVGRQGRMECWKRMEGLTEKVGGAYVIF